MNYIDVIAKSIEYALPIGSRPESDAQTLYRLYALLALTRGLQTTLEDVHNAWSVWMAERGEQHESLVPFSALSQNVQLEDRTYMEAIHSVVRLLDEP